MLPAIASTSSSVYNKKKKNCDRDLFYQCIICKVFLETKDKLWNHKVSKHQTKELRYTLKKLEQDIAKLNLEETIPDVVKIRVRESSLISRDHQRCHYCRKRIKRPYSDSVVTVSIGNCEGGEKQFSCDSCLSQR